jgi:hypothetical protein
MQGDAAQQGDEANEAFGGMVARMGMPPHARAAAAARGHRFAAYPQCWADVPVAGGSVDQILSRCGYRCDLCLAYRPNVEVNPANQQVLSDGWHKYFGFRIAPEAVICDGCMAENPRLIDKKCPVRPCAVEKGIANCSECGDYVCDKLSDRLVVYEALATKRGCPIPAEDRARFIRPYENKERLDHLRTARGAKDLRR